jgi:flagellar assembly protein FliH
LAAPAPEQHDAIAWPALGHPPDFPSLRGPAPAEERSAGPDIGPLVEQARTQALSEGEARADERWRGLWEVEQQRVARALAEIATWKARLRWEAEREMLALALAIARRILRREVQLDPTVLAGVLKAALDRCDQSEEVRVRASAAEAPQLRKHLEQIGVPVHFQIEPDPALAPGSLQVETSAGAIDASCDAQLAEIERGLADRLATARAGGSRR